MIHGIPSFTAVMSTVVLHGPWRDVGDKVSVASVDMAVVHVCDLDEGGALGFLAPPRSEKPVQAACLSRESKKNRPSRDG